jgi:hypothetical protein
MYYLTSFNIMPEQGPPAQNGARWGLSLFLVSFQMFGCSRRGDTALRFGHFFRTNPGFWLNLQAMYDLRLAEQKSGAAIKALPTLNRPVKSTRNGLETKKGPPCGSPLGS